MRIAMTTGSDERKPGPVSGLLRIFAAALIGVFWMQPVAAEETGSDGAASSEAVADNDTQVADEDADEADDSDEETFVITATRRETSEFEAPVSVTAFQGDFLNDYGMDRFADFAGLVPSLDFVEFAPGQTRITIRGISADPGISTASTVSVYLDDVPVTASNAGQQIDFRLFDLNRVEVLRGPQSTLFGENSMGGAIRFFTNEADPSEFETSYQAGLGEIENGGLTYRADGMLNLPLVEDRLAVRIVGSYRGSEGWVDNTTTGSDNVNSNRSWSGRASLSFTPNDYVSVTARANINHLEIDSLNETIVDDLDTTNSLSNSPGEDDYQIYSLDANWDMGFAELQSVTGFTHRDATVGLTEAPLSVATQNFYFTLFCVFGDLGTGCSTMDPAAMPITSSVYTRNNEEDIFTQELRLVSPGDQRLRWIVGGFYRDTSNDAETQRVTNPQIVFVNDAFLGLGYAAGDVVPGGFLADMGRTESNHIAGFGEVSYDVTQAVELTVGARTFREEFDYLPTTTSGLLALLGTGFTSFSDVSVPFSSSASDTNYKAVVSYRPSDTQHYYIGYTEGFRSGGANGLPTLSPNFEAEYDPDTTQNYEAGAKFIFNEGQFELSTAAYYVEWANLQVNDFDLDTGLGFTRNGGGAHSQGFEAELRGQLTDELSFTLGGNVTDAELDDPIAGSFNPVIPSGTRLPNVPNWSYGASLEYVRPVGELHSDFVVRFDVRGQGDSYSAFERYPTTFSGYPLSPKRSLQDGYNIANLRFGLENDTWSTTVYIDNIWNEVADLGDNNFGYFHRNQPRTIGMTVFGRF